jgi:hypothetical protein
MAQKMMQNEIFIIGVIFFSKDYQFGNSAAGNENSQKYNAVLKSSP